jgi:hypothetical protein
MLSPYYFLEHQFLGGYLSLHLLLDRTFPAPLRVGLPMLRDASLCQQLMPIFGRIITVCLQLFFASRVCLHRLTPLIMFSIENYSSQN